MVKHGAVQLVCRFNDATNSVCQHTLRKHQSSQFLKIEWKENRIRKNFFFTILKICELFKFDWKI